MTADSTAAERARALLADLGRADAVHGGGDHPAFGWRRAGLMAVTGKADGPPLMCPAALTVAADAALLALRALAPAADLPASGALLLGERARLMGLRRGGRSSANGSCRIIGAADGAFALNLARDDDWGLIPAWLEAGAGDWGAITEIAARLPVAPLVERGIQIGLPIACAMPAPTGAHWFHASVPMPCRSGERPLVVDLSPLWAGPLAASLLGRAGARVIKVESTRRPDGARSGHGGFYDLLNGGKESVALDFASADGRAALQRLIARADIVIEGSRPRGLAQLGVDAAAAVARGTIWVSITAHGRDGAAADRVGFGDDTAVAGGLANAMQEGWGEPLFAGDAIADPLTGLHAALAALAAWRNGKARLIALSLAGIVAHAIGAGIATGAQLAEWQAMADADDAPLYPLRAPGPPARPLGADTAEVLGEC
ncbi:CoA-transferase family III [Sphingomonas laterariae]|uniref:CoA-transferase family III n=1 Tax=Edaphosphingomonas laterariae TaxID=861865 RepID=A0A239D4H3_9SPHN|nr:CoA transferase [Sphingomonas laterariae]SNS27406.1 CoA-transferase family III [Sphingomonas laterariae]